MDLLARNIFYILLAINLTIVFFIILFKISVSVSKKKEIKKRKKSREQLFKILFEEKTLNKNDSITIEDLVESFKLSERDNQRKIRTIYIKGKHLKKDLRLLKGRNLKSKIEILRRISLFKIDSTAKILIEALKKAKNEALKNEIFMALLKLDFVEKDKIVVEIMNSVSLSRLTNQLKVKIEKQDNSIDQETLQSLISYRLSKKEYHNTYETLKEIKGNLKKDLTSNIYKSNSFYLKTLASDFLINEGVNPENYYSIQDTKVQNYIKLHMELKNE